VRIFDARKEVVRRLGRLLHDRIFFSTVALVVISFGTAGLATLAVDHLMVVTSADRFVQDWEVASLAPAEPQDRDIVIVAIKESTLRMFPYRSPVDRAFLSNLLTALARRHPRAIGVDVLFDQPTDDAKDNRLRETLRTLKAPLVVAWTNSPAVVTPEQEAYLDSFVPVRLRGEASLPEDQFDTARYLFPGAADAHGHYVPGFARALAAVVGKAAPTKLVPIIWHGRPARNIPAFREYPAETAAILPASWLAGKIILIGADLSLREDKHRTPFAAVLPGGEGTLPGVTIHAHALAQLLDQRKPVHVGWRDDLLVAFACAFAGGALGLLQLHILLRLVAGTLCLAFLWAGGALVYHAAGTMIGLVTPSLAFIASFSSLESLSGREARRQRQFIQGAFSRYVSPAVVQELVRDPSKMSLQGDRRVMSFLFTDIENFTTFSERLESHELAPLLNPYFDGITQLVLRHNGMVDKFIGDAVFAVFNAPVDLPDHAGHAVRCALEIDNFAEYYRRQKHGLGATRIGVHTGAAAIGNFGSSTRFTYTAQGDAVNTASRLEALNKHFGTRICVSRDTRDACTGIEFRQIGSVVLKGKTAAVEVWEPLHPGARSEAFLRYYESAYAKLAEEAPEAPALFQDLNRMTPGDSCVLLHLDRLRRGEKGVAMVMDSK
jgi:class 3 adenylate cyclase